MKKQILVLFLTMFTAFQAQAIIDIRAGYGVQTPGDEDYGAATIGTMMGFNADVIVELPMVPFGFGLRYESMGFDYENSGVSYSSDFQRTSLLVNYRLIDLFAYAGIIGTLGFSNEATFATNLNTQDVDTDFTYSIGAEAGVSLGLISVGAELGYLSANFDDTIAPIADADLSGVYAKAIVGVGF